jgi:hypothetical protein
MNINDCLQILNSWDRDTIVWLINSLPPIIYGPIDDPILGIIYNDVCIQDMLLNTAHVAIRNKRKVTLDDIVKFKFSENQYIANINTLQTKILNNLEPIPIYKEIDSIDSAVKFLNDVNSESYKWLKTEYSDVCSGGDVAINKILNTHIKINREIIWNDVIELFEQDEYNEEKLLYFIDHIFQSYKGYLEGHEPNPWWAS